ncbi:hypothetical protein [Winogradskyella sp.]|uniref:hypothetical protein n=1 Tax=Winogradskyella sp. TaxID=1883156 RepID=UPI001B0853AC|nr:hypothetical protein [Winogradskyella sp.]MBO6880274.1 hypothetical protein [Winogradskyella sp.]
MKTLIYILALAFTIQLSAQDPIMQKDSEALESVATSITKKYDDQLGLDGKQFTLFQKKIEEFLIREEKLHETYTGKEKLDMIYNLRKAETMEMRNILTQPQFDLYRRIKPQIQPLAVVDADEDKTEEQNNK